MMKTIQKRATISLAAFMTLISSACQLERGYVKGAVLESNDTMVVMSVIEEEGKVYVIDLMEDLKKAGKMTYEISSDGFIESINGVKNPADFSYCWMLYTSEDDLAFEEFGYIEYKGEKLYSAILGANEMPLDDDELYVWYYTKF